jgi:hypothetical protein
MQMANYISEQTAKYNPRIQRYENGDILFRWARPLHPSKIADAIGCEEEMIAADFRDLLLHVPADIATSEVK